MNTKPCFYCKTLLFWDIDAHKWLRIPTTNITPDGQTYFDHTCPVLKNGHECSPTEVKPIENFINTLEVLASKFPKQLSMDEYQHSAVKTAIYGAGHKIIYPSLGLANEAGEVLGKIKKVLRDNNGEFTPELSKEIGKEIGDVMWYIAALCKDLKLSLNDICVENLKKLEDRQKRGVIGGSGDNR
jgi:NTP pyrophosphatase (non-canonical NTP hydrolase)